MGFLVEQGEDVLHVFLLFGLNVVGVAVDGAIPCGGVLGVGKDLQEFALSEFHDEL